MQFIYRVLWTIVVLALPASAQSETPTVGQDPSDAAAGSLSAYEGQYEYSNGSTLIMVRGPNNKLLYASINGARYPLKPAGKDTFLNAAGVEVVFVRGDKDEIAAYREMQSEVPEENPLYRMLDRNMRLSRAIWYPRPKGAPEQYTYRAPKEINDGLPVGSPSSDDPLLERLESMTSDIYANAFPGVESVLLFKQGVLVFEEYFYAFERDTQHQQRSATKSLVALLLGAALDAGKISSLDAEVLPFFEEYMDLEHVDDNKLALTLRDLLSMQSGFDCDDWDQASPGNESKMVQTNDWARFMLNLPVSDPPGSRGSYCSGNVILIGKIIEKAVGMPLKQFADEALFGPLGIHDYQWDFRPDLSNTNNFVQAWLRPRDMLKIGILLADEGKWNGQQILSANWIEQLTSKQSEIGGTPYGYFFWRRYLVHEGQRVEIHQMSGNGGQKVILLDEHTILVLTGGNYNQQSHTSELLLNYILPGLKSRKSEDD